MGQEMAIEGKPDLFGPDLFGKDPVDWSSGDVSFRDFFLRCMAACKLAKATAPRFSWTEVGKGVFLLERSAATNGSADSAAAAMAGAAATNRPRFVALVNLEGWVSTLEFPKPLHGRDLLSGKKVSLEGEIISPEEPLFIEIDA
jgi:hypothetical protein